MRKVQHTPHTPRGFTLIEMLMAMSIFALLATMGYTGLRNVIDFQAAQSRIQAEHEDIQRALIILSRDLYQVVPRPVRDNNSAFLPALAFDDNSNRLEFTRGGNNYPIHFKRSFLQRIAYAFEGGDLYRIHWAHLDRFDSTTEARYKVLAKVRNVQYRFLRADNTWSKFWSPTDVADMPKALEVIITMESGTEYLHLFPIVTPNAA